MSHEKTPMTRARPAVKPRPAQRVADAPENRGSRRRASRSLWSACEALLAAAEPRALNRALDQLAEAFDCEGVALHVVGASGELEPRAEGRADRARRGADQAHLRRAERNPGAP